MPELRRLESTANDPTEGGILVTWPDAAPPCAKVAAWRYSGPVDPEQTARKIVEDLIAWGLAKRPDVVDSTNWVSLTAGVVRLVRDWNAALPFAVQLGVSGHA